MVGVTRIGEGCGDDGARTGCGGGGATTDARGEGKGTGERSMCVWGLKVRKEKWRREAEAASRVRRREGTTLSQIPREIPAAFFVLQQGIKPDAHSSWTTLSEFISKKNIFRHETNFTADCVREQTASENSHSSPLLSFLDVWTEDTEMRVMFLLLLFFFSSPVDCFGTESSSYKASNPTINRVVILFRDVYTSLTRFESLMRTESKIILCAYTSYIWLVASSDSYDSKSSYESSSLSITIYERNIIVPIDWMIK